MGQGKAILDTIRNWIVLTNLDNMITKLELQPHYTAIPFYKKYGLTHDNNSMSTDTLKCIIPKNFNIKNADDAAKIVKFNYKLYKTIPKIYKEDVKVRHRAQYETADLTQKQKKVLTTTLPNH